SFWADVSEVAVGRQPLTKIPTPAQELARERLRATVADARKELDTPTPELAALQKLWETQALADLEKTKPIWTAIKPARAVSSGKATLTVQDDKSVLASGRSPAKDNYTVTLTTDLKNITGLRLAALRHATLTSGGLSRANGNFVLTGIKVTVEAPGA